MATPDSLNSSASWPSTRAVAVRRAFSTTRAGEIFAAFPTTPHTAALRVACWIIRPIGGIGERSVAEALAPSLVAEGWYM